MLYCGLISVGLVGLSWVITAQQLVQQQWMPPLEQGQLLAARGAGAGRSQLVHACMPCSRCQLSLSLHHEQPEVARHLSVAVLVAIQHKAKWHGKELSLWQAAPRVLELEQPASG